MRLRNNKNALPKLKESGYLLENFPIFVDKNFVLELGMGKGEMLTKLAQKNPNIFYIGIEKFATVAEKASRKAKELNLNNFKIICDDISNILNFFEGKVSTIWLTFSDPWKKKKQAKRRLTFKKFLDLYKKVLTENGVIKFKTDNDNLFEWSIEHMKEYGMKLFNVTRDFHSHFCSKDNIMTEYEMKWTSLGKKINYLEARFNSSEKITIG